MKRYELALEQLALAPYWMVFIVPTTLYETESGKQVEKFQAHLFSARVVYTNMEGMPKAPFCGASQIMSQDEKPSYQL